ncbi:amine flavin-containing domain-containing [Cystoisospora suis]|uniref:Amine flavin-containing domain-containing n=1 Tax=Cystoisospora suis TaxID=483139 RepID=A0A2C6LD07_9APIC|nr:amine flavin-containing domain-containing [Cystoisospora suis]
MARLEREVAAEKAEEGTKAGKVGKASVLSTGQRREEGDLYEDSGEEGRQPGRQRAYAVAGERGAGEAREPAGDQDAVLEPRRCLPRRCNNDCFAFSLSHSSRGRSVFSKYTEMLKGRWSPPAARALEKQEKKRKRGGSSRRESETRARDSPHLSSWWKDSSSVPCSSGSAENAARLRLHLKAPEDGLAGGVLKGPLPSLSPSATRGLCLAPASVPASPSSLSLGRALFVAHSDSCDPASSDSSESWSAPRSVVPSFLQGSKRKGSTALLEEEPETTRCLVSIDQTGLSFPCSAFPDLVNSLPSHRAVALTGKYPALLRSSPEPRGKTDNHEGELPSDLPCLSTSFAGLVRPSRFRTGTLSAASRVHSCSELPTSRFHPNVDRHTRLVPSLSSSQSFHPPSFAPSSSKASLSGLTSLSPEICNSKAVGARAGPSPRVTKKPLLADWRTGDSSRTLDHERYLAGPNEEENGGALPRVPKCRTAVCGAAPPVDLLGFGLPARDLAQLLRQRRRDRDARARRPGATRTAALAEEAEGNGHNGRGEAEELRQEEKGSEGAKANAERRDSTGCTSTGKGGTTDRSEGRRVCGERDWDGIQKEEERCRDERETGQARHRTENTRQMNSPVVGLFPALLDPASARLPCSSERGVERFELRCDCVVIGAGVSGLAAAAYLRRCGAQVLVVEGKPHVGGRTFTTRLPARTLPDGRTVEGVYVDLGANYMHCVTRYRRRRARRYGLRKGGGATQAKGFVFGRSEGSGADTGGTGKTPFGFAAPLRDCRWRREPSRSVSGIAAVLKPLVADVCGKQNWESTFFCNWYDDRTGTRISPASTVRVHHILDQIRHRAAAKLAHLPPLLSTVSEDEAQKESETSSSCCGGSPKKEEENVRISSSGCLAVKSSDIKRLVQGPVAVPLSASFPAASCVNGCLADLAAVHTPAARSRKQRSLGETRGDSLPRPEQGQNWLYRQFQEDAQQANLQEEDTVFTTLLSHGRCPCTCGDGVCLGRGALESTCAYRALDSPSLVENEAGGHGQTRKKKTKAGVISSSAFSGYYPIGDSLVQQLLSPPGAFLGRSGAHDTPGQLSSACPNVQPNTNHFAELVTGKQSSSSQCRSGDTGKCCRTCCTGWCVHARMCLDTRRASQVGRSCSLPAQPPDAVLPAAAHPLFRQPSEILVTNQSLEDTCGFAGGKGMPAFADKSAGFVGQSEGRANESKAGQEGSFGQSEPANSVVQHMDCCSSACRDDDGRPVSNYSRDDCVTDGAPVDSGSSSWKLTGETSACTPELPQKRRRNAQGPFLQSVSTGEGESAVTSSTGSPDLSFSKTSSQVILRPVLPVGSFDDTGSRLSAWDVLAECAREVLAEENPYCCVAPSRSSAEENEEPTYSRKTTRFLRDGGNGYRAGSDSPTMQTVEAAAGLGPATHRGREVLAAEDSCDRAGRNAEEMSVKSKEGDGALDSQVSVSFAASYTTDENKQQLCFSNLVNTADNSGSQGVPQRTSVTGVSSRLTTARPDHSLAGPQVKEGVEAICALTEVELRMLMVHLQSRLGYVGDLREQSVSALKSFPFEVAVLKEASGRRLAFPLMEQSRRFDSSCSRDSFFTMEPFSCAEGPFSRRKASLLPMSSRGGTSVQGSHFCRGNEEMTGSDEGDMPGSPFVVSFFRNGSHHCKPPGMIFSSILPRPLLLVRSPPLRWSSSFVRTQQQHLTHALQREQQHPGPRIVPFNASAANSADKVVVEGWAWLPAFLALQVHPYILTQASAVEVKVSADGGEYEGELQEVLEGSGCTRRAESAAAQPEHASGFHEGWLRHAGRQENTRAPDESAWPVSVRVRVNDKQFGFTSSHGLIRCQRTSTDEKVPEGVRGAIPGEGIREGVQELQGECWELFETKQPRRGEDPVTFFDIRAKFAIVAVPVSQLASEPLRASSPAVPCMGGGGAPSTRDTTGEDLEACSTFGLLRFSPPLSAEKQQALSRTKMGVHNKIVIRWHPSDIFWDPHQLQLNCLDQKFQFLNLHAYGKEGCLLAHCFPPFSNGYGGLASDQAVVAEVIDVLQRMFGIPDKNLPPPVDYVVTRWHEDPFSRGSYSFPTVNAFDDDTDILRAPHPAQNPRVLFAGEYISKAYFQCVDGAFDTGGLWIPLVADERENHLDPSVTHSQYTYAYTIVSGVRAAECVAHEGLRLPLPPREDRASFALDVVTAPASADGSSVCRTGRAANWCPEETREVGRVAGPGSVLRSTGKSGLGRSGEAEHTNGTRKAGGVTATAQERRTPTVEGRVGSLMNERDAGSDKKPTYGGGEPRFIAEPVEAALLVTTSPAVAAACDGRQSASIDSSLSSGCPSSVLRLTSSVSNCSAQLYNSRLLNKCPFTGFPVPAVPEPLRGFYLTDNSDAGLTDMEGSTDESFFSPRGGGSAASKQRAKLQLREEKFLRACIEYIQTGGESVEREELEDNVRMRQNTRAATADVDGQAERERVGRQAETQDANGHEREGKSNKTAPEYMTRCSEKKVTTLPRSQIGPQTEDDEENEPREEEARRAGKGNGDAGIQKAFARSLPFPSQRLFYNAFLADLPLLSRLGDEKAPLRSDPAAPALPPLDGTSGGLCAFLYGVLSERRGGAGDALRCGRACAVVSLREEEAESPGIPETNGETTGDGQGTRQTRRGRKKQRECGDPKSEAARAKETVNCHSGGTLEASDSVRTRSGCAESISGESLFVLNGKRDDEAVTCSLGNEHTELWGFLAGLAQRDLFLRVRVLAPLLEAAQVFLHRNQQCSCAKTAEKRGNSQLERGQPECGSPREEAAVRHGLPSEVLAGGETVSGSNAEDSKNEEGRVESENRHGDMARSGQPDLKTALTRSPEAGPALEARARCERLSEEELLCRVYQKAARVLRRHARAAAFLPFLSPIGLAAFLADALPRIGSGCPTVNSYGFSLSRHCSCLAAVPAQQGTYHEPQPSHAVPCVSEGLVPSLVLDEGDRSKAERRGTGFCRSKGRQVSATSFSRVCRELERRLLRQLARSAYPSSEHSGEAALAELLRATGYDAGTTKRKKQKNRVGANSGPGSAGEVHGGRQKIRALFFGETRDNGGTEVQKDASLQNVNEDEHCTRRADKRGVRVIKVLEAKRKHPPLRETDQATSEVCGMLRVDANRLVSSGGVRSCTLSEEEEKGYEKDLELVIDLSTTEDSEDDERAGYHDRLCWMCGVGGDLILCDGHASCLGQTSTRSEASDEPEQVPCLADGCGEAQEDENGLALFPKKEREESALYSRPRESVSLFVSRQSGNVLPSVPSSSVVNRRTPSLQLTKRCRRVYHLGCIHPPPTDEELQPTATWRCPVCVGGAKKRRHENLISTASPCALRLRTRERTTSGRAFLPETGTGGAGGGDSRQHVTSLGEVDKCDAENARKEDWKAFSKGEHGEKRERGEKGTDARLPGGEAATAERQHETQTSENSDLLSVVDDIGQEDTSEGYRRAGEDGKPTGKERNENGSCIRSRSATRDLDIAKCRFGMKSSLSLHLVSLKKIFVEEVKVFLTSTRRVRRRYEWLAYQRLRREKKLNRSERKKGKREEGDDSNRGKPWTENRGQEDHLADVDRECRAETEPSQCSAREGGDAGDQPDSRGVISGRGRKLVDGGGERIGGVQTRSEKAERVCQEVRLGDEESTKGRRTNTATTRRDSEVDWLFGTSGRLSAGGDARLHSTRKSGESCSESHRGALTPERDQAVRARGKGSTPPDAKKGLHQGGKKGEEVRDSPGNGGNSEGQRVRQEALACAGYRISGSAGRKEQDKDIAVNGERESGEGELDVEHRGKMDEDSPSNAVTPPREKRHYSSSPAPLRTMLTRASTAAAAVRANRTQTLKVSGAFKAVDSEEETDSGSDDPEDRYFGRAGQSVDPFVAASRNRRFAKALRVLTAFYEYPSRRVPLVADAHLGESNLTFARVAWHLERGCCGDREPGPSPHHSTSDLPRGWLEGAAKGTVPPYAARSVAHSGERVSQTSVGEKEKELPAGTRHQDSENDVMPSREDGTSSLAGDRGGAADRPVHIEGEANISDAHISSSDLSLAARKSGGGNKDQEMFLCQCDASARRFAAEAVAELAVAGAHCCIRPLAADIRIAPAADVEHVHTRERDGTRATGMARAVRVWVSSESSARATEMLATQETALDSALCQRIMRPLSVAWLEFLTTFGSVNPMTFPPLEPAVYPTSPAALQGSLTGTRSLQASHPARTSSSDPVLNQSPADTFSGAPVPPQRPSLDPPGRPVRGDTAHAPLSSQSMVTSQHVSPVVSQPQDAKLNVSKNPKSAPIPSCPRAAVPAVVSPETDGLREDTLPFPVSAPRDWLFSRHNSARPRDADCQVKRTSSFQSPSAPAAVASTSTRCIGSALAATPVQTSSTCPAAHPSSTDQCRGVAPASCQSFFGLGEVKVPSFSRGPRKAAAKAAIVSKHSHRTVQPAARATPRSEQPSRVPEVREECDTASASMCVSRT